VNFRGQNIPLVTNTRSGLYKNIFTNLNPARVCEYYPNPTGQLTPGLVHPNFDEVKGGFNRPLGFKNTILRESRGNPVNGRGQNISLLTNTRSVLYKKGFYKSQLCTFCEHYLTPTGQLTPGLVQSKFDEVKGGFYPGTAKC